MLRPEQALRAAAGAALLGKSLYDGGVTKAAGSFWAAAQHPLKPLLGSQRLLRANTGMDDGAVADRIRIEAALTHILKPVLCPASVAGFRARVYHRVVREFTGLNSSI